MTNVNIYQFYEDNYVSLQDYNQLQSNWNSLREYVENEFTYDEYGMKMFDRSVLLDKMNELEGGDNVRINDSNDL